MGWYIGCFKKYAQFSGRARRREFWMFTLFNGIVAFSLMVVGLVLTVAVRNIAPLLLLFFAYGLVAFIPGLAVAVRRLHDTGRSGVWLLLDFVPFGGIVLLVFTCLDSQPGPNQYGPNPKFPEFTPDGYGFVGGYPPAGYPQPGYPPAGYPQGPVEGYGPDSVRDFTG